MGVKWARAFPTVRVPRRDAPKPVTLVYPYYENPQFFAVQLLRLFGRSRSFDPFVKVIVVDDGSPDHPAEAVIREADGVVYDGRLRLFRIDVDVPWNWLAARNIGLYHADPGWVLMTDMDHVVPDATLRAIVYSDHHAGTMYAFNRIEHTGAAIHPHSASFLLTKALFWKIGGYDERLSGHYGTDGDWRRRAVNVAPINILMEPLERHERVADASTQRYPRKLPEDAAAVARLVGARGKAWTPRTLTFPYHEVPL